jgi:hypothetical protein
MHALACGGGLAPSGVGVVKLAHRAAVAPERILRVAPATASLPAMAFSKAWRSAARRAVMPLAEDTATNRVLPAARKEGSVLVLNAPAPTQPMPGRCWRPAAGGPDPRG